MPTLTVRASRGRLLFVKMSSDFLILGVLLLTFAVPVEAKCDPSPAVVAVASVLSTLAVVALVLLAIFFFRRRSLRKGHNMTRPSSYQPHGMVNRAFSHPDDGGLSEQGFGSPTTLNLSKPKEFPKSSRDLKTWSSLPPADRFTDGISSRLDRQGSCGSLDDGFSRQDPDVISVTLESQDIIGLGFNISGNMSSGIQVSEVHNRGPARESGMVSVGDRILSVSVSYENIVYEDALTILSYASPYPVKLLLEKSVQEVPHTPILGPRPRRLSHPLFRSRSQDTMDKKSSPSPKRSRSNVTKHSAGGKGTGGRLFLKWKSGGGRTGSNSGSKPVLPEQTFSYREDNMRKWQTSDPDNFSYYTDVSLSSQNSHNVTTEAIITQEKDIPDTILNINNGKEKESIQSEDIPLASLPAVSDRMSHQSTTVAHVKTAPPGKPERKNRRKSDLQYEQQALSNPAGSQTQSDLPSYEAEVQEEIIVPIESERNRGHGRDITAEKTKDMEGALDLIRRSDFSSIGASFQKNPSPPGTPAQEEIIVPISKASAETNNNVKSLSEHDTSDKGSTEQNHREQTETQQQEKTQQQQLPVPPPGLDDKTLERIIAMNSFAPGTQGWAGMQAGGVQGGVRDDFVPDHPMFTSFPVVGDNHSVSSNGSNSTNPIRSSINRGVAYEIRDDFVAGRPVMVGLSKKGRVAYSGRQDSAASDTTTTSSGKGQGQGEGSECSDSLDWSGQRLVRSPSFSNIFVAE